MSKKIPLTITAKEISFMNGFSISTARREVKQIKEEHKESGKPIPKRITVGMYAKWSGISVEEITNFLNK